MKIFRPIWAEIDCDAVEHNLKLVRGKVGDKVRIMGVVKADAYGHGAVAVSKSLLHAGANALAVASLEEAFQLRDAGIKCDILILGYTQPNWASAVVEGGFIQTVYHLNLAKALSAEAVRLKKSVRVHIKIDSGMGRIGIQPEHAIHFIKEVSSLEGIVLDGAFTHLSMADDMDAVYTANQLERFNGMISELKTAGITIPTVHAANSAASVLNPEAAYDLVRPGILLYGLTPSMAMKDKVSEFRPVMTVKTTIVELKTVPVGSRISYSGTFTASGPTRIATLPAGYADGFSRRLSNRGHVLAGGRLAPIVGNVCMDFMMADVSGAPDVKVGDEVVLIGRQGASMIEVDEIAALMDTINYEVVTLIGKRVARVFTNYIAGNPSEI